MWGTSFLFTDISVAGVPAATVVAGRVVIAAGLLTGCVVATRRPWPRGSRIWLHFLALGIIGSALPFFLISWGQERIESGVAGLLMGVMPLATMVLAHFLVVDERITQARASGFLLGFAGVALLMGPDAIRGIGGDSNDVLRQTAVLGGALCYAVNTILAKKLPPLDPIVAAAGTMLMASAAIAPIALLRDAPWTVLPPTGSLAAIVWLGVVSTAAANIVYFTLVSSAGPTFLSFINYLIPGVALLAGITLLGEPFEWSSLAAFALILGGIYRGSGQGGNRGLEAAR